MSTLQLVFGAQKIPLCHMTPLGCLVLHSLQHKPFVTQIVTQSHSKPVVFQWMFIIFIDTLYLFLKFCSWYCFLFLKISVIFTTCVLEQIQHTSVIFIKIRSKNPSTSKNWMPFKNFLQCHLIKTGLKPVTNHLSQ